MSAPNAFISTCFYNQAYCRRSRSAGMWLHCTGCSLHKRTATQHIKTHATHTHTHSDFTFIFGGIALLMALIPSFRNMRLFSLLALLGTTYTSW